MPTSEVLACGGLQNEDFQTFLLSTAYAKSRPVGRGTRDDTHTHWNTAEAQTNVKT